MAWFKSKTVDDVFDKDSGLLAKAGAWYGNQNLTDEEVMEANAKSIASVQDFVVKSLSESTMRSKSRRGFTMLWSYMHVGVIALFCIARPFDKTISDDYLLLVLNPWICSITGAIVMFHYGSHGLQKYQESKKK